MDRATRGKSRPGRLRLLQPVLDRELRGAAGTVVDLGLGAVPWTTLEWALPEGLALVAVDIDPGRVERARREGLDARVGGFELPLTGLRLVRAMNVLRQYEEGAHLGAIRSMGGALEEGGALLEGTTDKPGQVLAARLWRRRGGGLLEEALFCATDFSRGFAPAMLRYQLPPGRRGLLEGWTEAWRALGPLEPVEAFARSAAAVGELLGPGLLRIPLAQSGLSLDPEHPWTP